MKILSNSKIANYCLISAFSLVVVLMLSSFLIRIVTPPISAELSAKIEKANEMEQIIQVNVLNACGKTGLANDVKNYLLKRGFDVVEIGNYDVSLDISIVVDRVGDLKSSNQVAYALGIDNSYVTTEIDSTLFVRSTVIIGRDYFSLKPFN